MPEADRSIALSEAQAITVGKLADLHGGGELRPHDNDALTWVWFKTRSQDWSVDEKGRVRGFNDVKASR
jgi:hypothetical protein